MSNALAIDVRGLHKQFGDHHVVNGVSLQVQKGEIYGFLGPNGSGKTTTLRLLCGLLHPDGGEGTCLGYDLIAESDRIKREVGYMTQRFSFWEDLTLRENLEFVARMYRVPDRREAIERALGELGALQGPEQLTGTLSGGWKQRLALAACKLHKPRLLLLDEPTAGIDPAARRDFWEELNRLSDEGVTVLVSTHYMDEAERCHRLAYIVQGSLLTRGSAEEIVDSQNLHTWRIVGGDVSQLSRSLEQRPEVEQTVLFGTSLHASGLDSASLEAALRETIGSGTCDLQHIETTLEDVVIYLTRRARQQARE